MIISANTVNDWMYRGSDYQLPVTIIDEDGNATSLEEEDVVYLMLYDNIVQGDPILQLEADIYHRSIGLVVFTFEPEDTVSLMTKAYDLSIAVKEDGTKIRPIFTGRFAIYPFNAPILEVVEEEEEEEGEE